MDLETFKSILAGERADDLSPVEADAFEHLLRTSQAARDALAAAEDELAPLANRFDPIEPTPQQWGRVDAAIREEAARSAGRSRFRALPVWVAACAAALLVVTIGFSVPTELFRTGNATLGGTVADPTQPRPQPPKPSVPITPHANDPRHPVAESVPSASVIGGEAGLKYDPNLFEAGYHEVADGTDGILCVWVRDKRL
jgi:hypothetical protein